MSADSVDEVSLVDLLAQVRACRHCQDRLPLGPRPVLRAGSGARLLIIGQAPGTRVHASGIPWDDPSGDRLRRWLQLDNDRFYDESQVAIIPMGFCYPGKGKSGDLPPSPDCAPLWHDRLLRALPDIRLVLLVGVIRAEVLPATDARGGAGYTGRDSDPAGAALAGFWPVLLSAAASLRAQYPVVAPQSLV